jgi:hypothetical protein
MTCIEGIIRNDVPAECGRPIPMRDKQQQIMPESSLFAKDLIRNRLRFGPNHGGPRTTQSLNRLISAPAIHKQQPCYTVTIASGT